MHNNTGESINDPSSPGSATHGSIVQRDGEIVHASGIESPFVLPGDSVIESGVQGVDHKPSDVPIDQSNTSNATVTTLHGTQLLLQSKQTDNVSLTDFVLDTKLFNSGLDEATLTGSLYHMIDPVTRREIANLIINTKKIIYNSTSAVFNKLKTNIDERKLFVMFENLLDCNPKYDHLNPKSILPIFVPFIEEAEMSIYKLILPQLHHEIEATVARTLETDTLRKQTMLDELDDLKLLVDQLKNQLADFELGISQCTTLNAIDRKVLLQRIITLKEQLHWRGRLAPDSSSIQYKPDYMDIRQSRGRVWSEDLDDCLDEDVDGAGTENQLLCLKNKRLLQALEDDVKLLERKIEERRQLIAQLNAKHELMEEEIKRLTDVLDASDERHRQLRLLKKESDELDKVLAEMHANYDAKMKEIETLQKRYTKGIEDAEQRTASLANKLRAARTPEQFKSGDSNSPNVSKKNSLEIDKLKDQLDKLSKELIVKNTEIEQLKLESKIETKMETKTESSQTTPWSPQKAKVNIDTPDRPSNQATREEPKDNLENICLTTKLKEQSDEIDRLRKQLENITSRLSEAEAALKKEYASEKVPLDDSMLTQMDQSAHKNSKKDTITRTIGCETDAYLQKELSNRLFTDHINDYKEFAPEEEFLKSVDSSTVFNKTLVTKAKQVLQATIELTKHRVASSKDSSSIADLSEKEKIDIVRQTVMSLLEEKELSGLIDAHHEEITDLITIESASKAAKAALCDYRDISIGVYNGTDDDRSGSIGDDWEADGYNSQVNRASHAADTILRARKGTTKFQIHYNSHKSDLNRPDDVFNRLYNLAETTRKKLDEKRKEYLAKLSEKEAHRLHYKIQAADTIASVVNTAIELIGRSIIDKTDLAEAKSTIKDTFTDLLGTVLNNTEVPSSSVDSVIDEIKDKIVASLIALQKVDATEGNTPTTVSPQRVLTTAMTDALIISQPISQGFNPGSTSIPSHTSFVTQSDVLHRSTSLPVNLTVQSLSLNVPVPSEDTVYGTYTHQSDTGKNPVNIEIPPCIIDPLMPTVTSLEPPIFPEDLCASSTLRSFPSRNHQQRSDNVSGRVYLFSSSGDVVGFISAPGNITFYGDYAQYSTNNRVISDVSDTTCSLLSSRGSSKNSSRANSRVGSAQQKSGSQCTYMLQKINIYDPAVVPQSHHTTAVQTELTLLYENQSRIEYLDTDKSGFYRHRMVHNYKDIPLGNVFSADSTCQLTSNTPTNTALSFSADCTHNPINQIAPCTSENCCSAINDQNINRVDLMFAEAKQGMRRSNSCILVGSTHRTHSLHLATGDRGVLSDKGSANDVSWSESPHSQHHLLFINEVDETMHLMERRAKSVGERTRKGFQAVDARTGRLNVSAEDAAELEKQLARLADNSLINPDRVGSTIQKPTLLIYDTDTAPIRYRKAVEYISGIGGDPRDINIMAVVTESGAMLRDPDMINSLTSQVEYTPVPLADSKSSSATAYDALAPQVDTLNAGYTCVSPVLSAVETPREEFVCPASDVISECSVYEDTNTNRPNILNQLKQCDSKQETSFSTETTHKKLLSSFTDLIKKRDDAFLVKSYDTSQMHDSIKKTPSDTQPLLTVKVASTSFEKLPQIVSGSRSSSVEPIKVLNIYKDRSKSVSDTATPFSPRMKIEDLDDIPVVTNKCYLNDVTEKSLMRISMIKGSIPSLSSLRDSRGNPLIFNDRMVDDTGQIHSIHLHKDGWEHMRGSVSSSIMKQQVVNKLKTLTTCSSQLKINPVTSTAAEQPLLVSSVAGSAALPTKPLPKPVISRGSSAAASRRITQPLESLQPRTPLKPL